MAQLAGDDETGMLRIELAEIGRSMRSSFGNSASSFCGVIHDNVEDDNDHDHEERDPQWAAVDRLPSFERVTTALFDDKDGKRLVDITKLGAEERHMFIEKLIRHIENDNLRLLHQIKRRVDRYIYNIFNLFLFLLLCMYLSRLSLILCNNLTENLYM